MPLLEEESLHCPTCRHAIRDDIPSCPRCGTKFNQLEPIRGSKVWIIVTALLLLALFLGGVVSPLAGLFGNKP